MPPGTTLTLEASCFCRGTLILTDHGEIAVEDLMAGDILKLHDGRAAPAV